MPLIEKLLQIGSPQNLGYEGIFKLLIQLHISFGLVSLVTGFTILALSKGTPNHKKVGRVFVGVMLGNFMLGVPLGSLGQLMVGEPASFMTVIGAIFVGAATFSGYRLAKVGAGARAWYDKAALGLQMFAAACYFYVAALMVAGRSLFGSGPLLLKASNSRCSTTDSRCASRALPLSARQSMAFSRSSLAKRL